MQLEVDLGAVADQQVLARVREALGLERRELLEEGLEVDDDARADQVGAVRVDEARGQEVEAGEDVNMGDSGEEGVLFGVVLVGDAIGTADTIN